mgnify:CR=1 FL=1
MIFQLIKLVYIIIKVKINSIIQYFQFFIGMIIHWLPERWKRWYRYNFAVMPLPVMAFVTAIAVFIIYQFITAELQAFIYFQF